MAVKSVTVTATTTAGLLISGGAAGVIGSNNFPLPVAIKNLSAEVVYIGGPDVTSANGFPLAENDVMNIDLIQGDDIYCRTGANTADLRVFTTRR